MKNSKKKLILLLSIILLCIFGGSFAYLTRGELGKKKYEIDAGILSLKINDGENNISLDNCKCQY